MRTQRCHRQPGSGPHHTASAGTLNLDIQPWEPWRVNFYGISVTAAVGTETLPLPLDCSFAPSALAEWMWGVVSTLQFTLVEGLLHWGSPSEVHLQGCVSGPLPRATNGHLALLAGRPTGWTPLCILTSVSCLIWLPATGSWALQWRAVLPRIGKIIYSVQIILDANWEKFYWFKR